MVFVDRETGYCSKMEFNAFYKYDKKESNIEFTRVESKNYDNDD